MNAWLAGSLRFQPIPNALSLSASMTKSAKPSDTNPYPLWAPRFWHGMLVSDWLKLVMRHRARIHPLRWGLAIGVSFATLFNSKMRLAQLALYGHRISKTPVPDDPIFILGHWRSGTTFLHELMSIDDRFTTPTTFQCFCANHFLLTQAWLTRLLWFLLPSRRPMDNVAAGWHAPQEDEFALCSMGVPSPYLRMAFPNDSIEDLEYLDMDGLGPVQLDEWKSAFVEFLRRMSVGHSKRIVLKSPTHTGRIRLLSQMFPNAKFIHIARDPYDVVPSTLRLWKSLDDVQGLQIPHYKGLESYVHRAYARMYGGYRSFRASLQEHQIIDIRYESLVEDSCGVMQQIYDQLQLGNFDVVRPELERTLQAKRDYKKNVHQLDQELVASINHHWREYFEDYGYTMLPVETADQKA